MNYVLGVAVQPAVSCQQIICMDINLPVITVCFIVRAVASVQFLKIKVEMHFIDPRGNGTKLMFYLVGRWCPSFRIVLLLSFRCLPV